MTELGTENQRIKGKKMKNEKTRKKLEKERK